MIKTLAILFVALLFSTAASAEKAKLNDGELYGGAGYVFTVIRALKNQCLNLYPSLEDSYNVLYLKSFASKYEPYIPDMSYMPPFNKINFKNITKIKCKNDYKNLLEGFDRKYSNYLPEYIIIHKKQLGEIITNILNLKALPTSLIMVNCDSIQTKLSINSTCSIEINPNDFSSLLKGRTYKENKIVGTSHSLVVPKVGEEYPVKTEYISTVGISGKTKSIKVLVNKNKTKAVIYFNLSVYK